jgi:hypothetical protein
MCVCTICDPVKDSSWGAKANHLPTDEIHVAEVRQGQVCTHVCIGFAHVCVYVYVSVCLCLCIYIYIYVCVCVCKIHRPVKDASWGAKTNLPTNEIHVTEVRQGQVCTHVYLVCVFLCMVVYMHTYIHTCTHAHMHTYIHTYACIVHTCTHTQVSPSNPSLQPVDQRA